MAIAVRRRKRTTTRLELERGARGKGSNGNGYMQSLETAKRLTSSSNSSILNLNVSSDNYPSVVTFFEQRLVFAGTNNNPQTIFFSKNGSYTDFTTGSNADDALVYTIASNTVNEIRWMSATRVLVIGTAGGEFVVTTSSQGPITPTTTDVLSSTEGKKLLC